MKVWNRSLSRWIVCTLCYYILYKYDFKKCCYTKKSSQVTNYKKTLDEGERETREVRRDDEKKKNRKRVIDNYNHNEYKVN